MNFPNSAKNGQISASIMLEACWCQLKLFGQGQTFKLKFSGGLYIYLSLSVWF